MKTKKWLHLLAIILCFLLALTACGGNGVSESSQYTPEPIDEPVEDEPVEKETPQHIIDLEAELTETFDHFCLYGPATVIASDDDEYLITLDFTGDNGVWDKVTIDVAMGTMQSILDSLFMYIQGNRGYTVEEMNLPLYSESNEVGLFTYIYTGSESYCDLQIGGEFLSQPYEVPANALPGAYDTPSVSLASFEGRWYNYPSERWLEIEGDTFKLIEWEEYPGHCELTGETLQLLFDGDYYADIEVTLSLEGTLLVGWLGHFRPQAGTEPAPAPIDLSANSYLGDWYCAELDESISLGHRYRVYHGTTVSAPAGGYYSDGIYEPFGNLLVLSYTGTLGGEETIFNGGDAVYDPEAQTLTTADQYVYERAAYGGGYKTIPDHVTRYDLFFDWNSPYISKEEIAAEIIAVWQEHDEAIDSRYFDVATLVDVLDNCEYGEDEENLFEMACEQVGVDATTYFGYRESVDFSSYNE